MKKSNIFKLLPDGCAKRYASAGRHVAAGRHNGGDYGGFSDTERTDNVHGG